MAPSSKPWEAALAAAALLLQACQPPAPAPVAQDTPPAQAAEPPADFDDSGDATLPPSSEGDEIAAPDSEAAAQPAGPT